MNEYFPPSVIPEFGFSRITQLVQQNSDLQTGAIMTQLRAKLSALLNLSVVEQKNAHKRSVFATDEASFDFLGLESHLNIGMDFVVEKRGETRLLEYLKDSKIDDLVAIGIQVVRERFWSPQDEIRKRNNLPFQSVSSKQHIQQNPLPLTISGKIHDLRKIKQPQSLGEIKRHGVNLARIERFFSLAEELGVDIESCSNAYRRELSPFPGILEQSPDLGFLEIAVFVACFERRFGVKKTGIFSLQEGDFKKFLELVDELPDDGGKKYVWKREEKEKFLAIALELFPNFPEAKDILKYYLTMVSMKNPAGSSDYGQNRFDQKSLQRNFPTLTLPVGVRGAPRRKKSVPASTENLSHLDPLRVTSLEALLLLPNEQFLATIEAYPDAICWHRHLLECFHLRDVDRGVRMLNRMASEEPSLATECLLLLLSLEQELMSANPHSSDVINLKKPWMKAEKKIFALELYVSPKLLESARNDMEFRLKTQSRIQESTQGVMQLDQAPGKLCDLYSPMVLAKYWHPIMNPDQGARDASPEDGLIPLLLRENRPRHYSSIIRYGLDHVSQDAEYWGRVYSILVFVESNMAIAKALGQHLPWPIFKKVMMYVLLHHAFNIDEKEVTLFDVPITLFLDESGEQLLAPAGWEAVKYFNALSDERRRDLAQLFQESREMTLEELMKAHESPSEDEDYSRLLTTQEIIMKGDVPIVKELLKSTPDERLVKILKSKLSKSSPEVKKMLKII